MLRQNNMAIRGGEGKDSVKYSIDAVLTAIRQRRKIRFQYLAIDENLETKLRRGGLRYVVNPYALIWQEEKYYLICNYEKYDDLSYYRLDRMRTPEILGEPVRDAEALFGGNADLKIRAYAESTIYRYGGELIHLRLFCRNGMQDEILDSFDNFAFQKADDGFFATVSVRDGEGLIYWLMQHGPYVKVLSPEPIRQKLIDALRVSLSQYTQPPVALSAFTLADVGEQHEQEQQGGGAKHDDHTKGQPDFRIKSSINGIGEIGGAQAASQQDLQQAPEGPVAENSRNNPDGDRADHESIHAADQNAKQVPHAHPNLSP